MVTSSSHTPLVALGTQDTLVVFNLRTVATEQVFQFPKGVEICAITAQSLSEEPASLIVLLSDGSLIQFLPS